MADTFTREKRSDIMRRVKGRDTSLEMALRGVLWRSNLRYRVNVGELPGKPDIVFTRWKVAVFIDSCFFHGCESHLRRPKSNQDYWDPKIARNVARDRAVDRQLSDMSWTVVRLWEHDLKRDLISCAERVREALAQSGNHIEK